MVASLLLAYTCDAQLRSKVAEGMPSGEHSRVDCQACMQRAGAHKLYGCSAFVSSRPLVLTLGGASSAVDVVSGGSAQQTERPFNRKEAALGSQAVLSVVCDVTI